MKKGYGRMITEARAAAGFTQDELARRVGVSRETISRIETEKRSIDPDTFQGLINVLRSLEPAALVEAMGYPLHLTPAERVIPRDVIEKWPRLPEETRRAVRGTLLALREDTDPPYDAGPPGPERPS